MMLCTKKLYDMKIVHQHFKVTIVGQNKVSFLYNKVLLCSIHKMIAVHPPRERL